MISFEREFLKKYTQLTPTPLEKAESIDMLRILEHGMKVKMVNTYFETRAVDTREDLLVVEKLIKDLK